MGHTEHQVSGSYYGLSPDHYVTVRVGGSGGPMERRMNVTHRECGQGDLYTSVGPLERKEGGDEKDTHILHGVHGKGDSK